MKNRNSYFYLHIFHYKDRNAQKYKVVCYYEGKSGAANGFQIDHIDPCLCTHLIYKFAILHNGYIILPENAQLELNTENNGNNGLYRRFNSLKASNPSLSTMIAVGGGDQNFISYVNLMQNAELRFLFAQNVVRFLINHGFDGLDIGWSYPSSAQNPQNIYHNYVLLLRELRNQFEPHGFLLSASISGFQQQIDTFYNVAGISDNVDFLNVASFTQPHGPIYEATPLFAKTAAMQPFSISYIVRYLLAKQVDPRKLIVGLPAYGLLKHSQVENKGNYVPGFTFSIVNYNQICLRSVKSNVAFDSTTKTASFVSNGIFSFDDQHSFNEKIRFVRDQRLGGVMIYSLEMDDFSGTCGLGRFPLTSTAKSLNLKPICENQMQTPTHIYQMKGINGKK